jgi:tetratricopeptide (TPR) repeat protein
LRWLWALALWLVAASASAHGDVSDRIAEASAALERTPNDAALLVDRGALHVLDENWTQAALDFEEARAIDPALRGVDLRLASALLHLGEAERVIALTNAVIAKEPTNADAHLLRARAHVDRAEHQAAASDFTQVIALSTTPIPRTYLERAEVIAAAGDIDGAIAGLREGIDRLGPAVSLIEQAIALEEGRQRYDAALVLLTTLSPPLRSSAKWCAREGELLTRAGRSDEARAAYERALAALDAADRSRRNAPAALALRSQIERARTELPTPAPPAGDRRWIAVLLVAIAGAYVAFRHAKGGDRGR